MAIDDPLEKIRELAKSGDFDGIGAALQVGGAVSPIFKVGSIAKSIATSYKSGEKIWIAIIALCDELQRTQDRWPKDLESAFDTDWFKRAMTVLMEESARAVNEDYARLLARVAAQGCFPSEENKHRQEDLASYIRDLAQLGADDIQMLKILRDAYKDVFRNTPNLHDPNRFTNHNESFKHAADKLNIHPDDRLSLGARLSGFGLAFESVPQIEGRFFRPTRRGFYLLSLLEAAELPIEQQN
ncbi:MAG: hypothetical protein ACYDBH_09905 [Acidobacteriaceae bacterium]